MKKELIIKKCLKCGAIIKVLEDCSCKECDFICCGDVMQTLEANTTNAAVEKHVPEFEIENDTLKVKVNHIMEENHFIEWICLKTDSKEEYVYLNFNKKPVATFENVDNGILYAYCNQHGLWSKEISK